MIQDPAGRRGCTLIIFMAASQEFKFKCQKIEARIAKGNKNTECCEHE